MTRSVAGSRPGTSILREQLSGFEEFRDAPLVAKPFPGDRRHIRELVSDAIAEILVMRQVPFNEVPVSKLTAVADTVEPG